MKLNLLIIGSGMYVSGRGTSGVGTILPAALTAQKNGLVDQIHVASSTVQGTDQFKNKLAECEKLMGLSSNVTFGPTSENSESWKDLAKKMVGPKAAILCTPNHTHFEFAKYLLELGFHVQVAKPFVTTVKEADELIKLQSEKNVIGAVEFHKRYDRANRIIKNRIQKGEIGKLLTSIVEYSQRRDVPEVFFKQWASETNIFEYLAVHYVDLIHWMTGAKVKDIKVSGQKKVLVNSQINAFDAIQALIEWSHPDFGPFSTLVSTHWLDPNNSTAMSDQKITFIGTEGRIQSDQKNRGLFINSTHNLEHVNPDFSQMYKDAEFYEIEGYGPESVWDFLETALNKSQNVDISKKVNNGHFPSFTSARESVVITAMLNSKLQELKL